MKKEDLLHHCRFYKGEKDIKSHDPDVQAFAKIEREWIDLTINAKDGQSDLLSESLNDYLLNGLREFEKYDDTPLSLKALLFNRFMKYNERFDIDAFKEWYRDQYIKKSNGGD